MSIATPCPAGPAGLARRLADLARRTALLAILALVTGSAPAWAQTGPTALVTPPLLASTAGNASDVARPGQPRAFATGTASYRLVQGIDRDRRWEGALVGFAVGAAVTWYALYQGGSTGPCNRRDNQDAWSSGQCAAAAAAGGLVLAPVGYYIGSRIRVGGRRP